MNPVTGIAMYVIIWWTLLFVVLPFGTHPVAEPDESTGGWRGAPDKARIGRKMLVNTLLSAAVWTACYIVITGPWLSFRTGWLAMPPN
jgi:predicted secreted protein